MIRRPSAPLWQCDGYGVATSETIRRALDRCTSSLSYSRTTRVLEAAAWSLLPGSSRDLTTIHMYKIEKSTTVCSNERAAVEHRVVRVHVWAGVSKQYVSIWTVFWPRAKNANRQTVALKPAAKPVHNQHGPLYAQATKGSSNIIIMITINKIYGFNPAVVEPRMNVGWAWLIYLLLSRIQHKSLGTGTPQQQSWRE